MTVSSAPASSSRRPASGERFGDGARPAEGAHPTGVVALLGVGVMGEAVLSGLLRAGRAPESLRATSRRPERLTELAERYGVRACDNAAAVAGADAIVLGVKPQDMTTLLAEVGPEIKPGTLVVSIAAGVPTASIEAQLAPEVPVVRAMPNTPSIVDAGVSALAPGRHCTPAHLAAAEALLRSVGDVVRVPESQLDAVTAVSGSGPAYVFYVVEAMIEAGVLLGLSREVASRLVTATLRGAGTMVAETGTHPSVLREQVTSPAGTTVSALRVLDDRSVRAAFLAAMSAARDRSVELGRALES